MVHIVLSAVLAALFIATGAGKVLGLGYANKLRDDLHVASNFWRITGVLEWAGAAGLIIGIWNPALGTIAAFALACLMLGAAVTRLRSSRISGSTTGLAQGLAADLGIAVVVGITCVLIYTGK